MDRLWTLASTNLVRVNELTLGEKTWSPDAISIPARLALTLIQGKEGVIRRDVPIEGKLDVPALRLGKVIWHTILNVLVKVATSPFRSLRRWSGREAGDPGGRVQSGQIRAPAGAAGAIRPPGAGRWPSGLRSGSRWGAPPTWVTRGTLRREALGSLRGAKAHATNPAPASEEGVTVAPEERPRALAATHWSRPPSTRRGSS